MEFFLGQLDLSCPLGTLGDCHERSAQDVHPASKQNTYDSVDLATVRATSRDFTVHAGSYTRCNLACTELQGGNNNKGFTTIDSSPDATVHRLLLTACLTRSASTYGNAG